MKERISNYFEFNKLGTSYRQETIAGLTTFLAMAYILFVNPSILSLSDIKDFPEALRMNKEAIFVATSLAAAYGSILMGIYAKYPIALAPGMGLNAFFAFNVVLGMGIPWQTALAGVFVSGIIFIILSLTGLREQIINAIPIELKLAIGSGIGFFVTFVGLKNSGIIVSNPATFVSLGKLNEPAVLLTIFGLVITVVLMARKVKAGVFLGMIITAIAGMIFGIIDLPSSVVGPVPSIAPTFGQAIKHIPDVFSSGKMFAVVLTFFIVDFFDATGTLVAVANQAGLLKENKLERAGKALMVDATAVVVGSTLGTSTTTSYIESTAGVAAGGRTGFSAVVTGILFLLALFFAPLLGVVTAAVTSPALIVVGVLMVSSIGQIDWKKFEIAVPAFFTIIAMPLTYSIATGIAVGFIFYPISMIAAGKTKKIHPVMYILFVVFLFFLAYFRD